MSKKEQKLKKDLYKALTEYFIHNPKNSLTSSESILDQLASFRMETGLPAALRQDKKYQKKKKKCFIGIIIINEIVYNRMQKLDGGVI